MQMSTMSSLQQAGQHLMVGFDGHTFNDELRYAIDTLKVGGLILFTRNIITPDQIQNLCHDAQAYAGECGQPPLFISIDQEGGCVARLKPPFTQFAGNPSMRSPEDAIAFAETTVAELSQIGVNMNMAPVLDVAPPQGPSVMSQRVFGSDPIWVGKMGATVIEHLQSGGIMAVGKHFPGIGRTVLDSHEDLPDLETDLPALGQSDLIPFQSAIQSNVSSIMLSHIRYTGIDPQWPASLSKTITQNILRNQLGFNGLVLTDDLDMGAIAKHYELADIVVKCLLATVDILLICHSGPNIEAAFQQILQLIPTSEEMEEKHAASVERIIEAKKKYLGYSE